MPSKNEREPFYRIDVAEATSLVGDDEYAVIDVRNPDEYAGGHLPGATLIPVNSVFQRREELPKDKKIIFVCAVGQRSALAAEMAAAAGLPADRLYNLDGGTESDDGAVIYLRRDGSIRRLDIYEDRDGSGSFTMGDVIRLTRGSSPSLTESQTGPVTATRHCCVDLDREGPPDDGILVLSRPGEAVLMAAIYETGGDRPLR